MFSSKASCVRLKRLPMKVGSYPLKPLLFMSKYFRYVQLTKEVKKLKPPDCCVYPILFEPVPSHLKFHRFPKFIGSGPLIL